MTHLLAFLSAMLGTAILAAVASALLFRDYREGFRMLYHLFDNEGSHSLPEDVPQPSRRGWIVQLVFAASCLAAASIGYANLTDTFARWLGN